MREEHYDTLKRIFSVITAISLWFLSLRFSVEGFSIQVPNLVWAGWVLGLAITVIELIFTSQGRGKNSTLIVLGIFAYAYGIWSNVVGIYASRGATSDGLINTNMLFSVILGIVLEIAPEPLFLWGLLGGDTEEGDIVSTISRIWRNVQRPPTNVMGKRGPGRPRKDAQTQFQMSMPRTDTVSEHQFNYLMATRLGILTAMNDGSGRLVWDKNKSQSPVFTVEGRPPVSISRALIRQMVEEKALIEKQRGSMITEYVVSGSEPPVRR